MVWYSHLFKNFPQFVVILTVKGFGIVNKAEIDVFLKLSEHLEVHSSRIAEAWLGELPVKYVEIISLSISHFPFKLIFLIKKF